MKKKLFSALIAGLLCLCFCGCSAVESYIDGLLGSESGVGTGVQSGLPSSGGSTVTEEEELAVAPATDFEYKVRESGVTLTKYLGSAERIIVPDTVEGASVVAIASGAFENSSEIKELVIPDSVAAVGHGALSGCTKLEVLSLPYAGGEEDSHSYIGYVFGANKPSENAKTVPNTLKELTVGGSKIVDDAFYGMERLKKLKVKDSVKEIEKGAFADLDSLETLTVPFIGGTAEDTAPFGFIFGGDSYGDNRKVLPSSLRYVTVTGETKVLPYDFYGAERLSIIDFCGTVTSVGEYAFAKCEALKKATGLDKVKTVGQYGFAYCKSLTELSLPLVSRVENNSFYGCLSLKGVTLSEELDYIGECAFAFCESVYEITLSEALKALERRTFYGCSGLVSIDIPEGVETLGDEVFCGCTALKKLSGGEGVNSVGEKAFEFCPKTMKKELKNGSFLATWFENEGK